MLSKQSIRGEIQILANGEPIGKEEIIALSETWNENQEIFFRKMLKQGGRFKIKDIHFSIKVQEQLRDSRGGISAPLKS
jgi:hypothetical protein